MNHCNMFSDVILLFRVLNSTLHFLITNNRYSYLVSLLTELFFLFHLPAPHKPLCRRPVEHSRCLS
jgi:hypothetical protein